MTTSTTGHAPTGAASRAARAAQEAQAAALEALGATDGAEVPDRHDSSATPNPATDPGPVAPSAFVRPTTMPPLHQQLVTAAKPTRRGKVTGTLGLSIDVSGLALAVGEAVRIVGDEGPVLAEVVALGDETATCMPISDLRGIRTGCAVETTGGPVMVPVGLGLLGRVVNALGRPIDGGPPLTNVSLVGTDGTPPPAMGRDRIATPMPLGVRAVDAMIPCGRGQRLGIFAGSGVGKSSLLSMVVKGTQAPVCVLALVGERGREVREFVEGDLGPEGLERAVVVVATSDEPALVRLRAAFTATRIAEWFRDQGQDVVLCMDSVTRVAMAQREVGLAAGEPPATRGYPPSVFGLMPRLLERAGTAPVGSITGLYTVLVDGDDLNDPIADNVRSILDGHIVLSRRLATSGHFPSIDVLESISRAEKAITTPEQRADARVIRQLMAARRDAKDLIEIGAYVPGSNPTVDRALRQGPAIDGFLQQDLEELSPPETTWAALHQLASAE